ncbi:MAG TPA: FAD-binding protein [Candidatus Kapabacteria bacterium]|nr:FAD-binding protein [Candidatus Kapabacteria bacterium]
MSKPTLEEHDRAGDRTYQGAHVGRRDPRYGTLVQGFNQRFTGRPHYVELCGDTNAVLRSVQKALDAGRRITVRGGGHCYEDFVSGNVGGVIIDLSPLNRVYLDRARDLFCIEGGCTLWNVYTQLYKEHGVAIPAGSCYSVGAGGHIIGGGYGLLSRLHGLTVDWLHAVEVVVVNEGRRAEVITVGRDSTSRREQDLFWGHLGGGGGNFGIVTRYFFQAPPAAPSIAHIASIAWNWDEIDQDQFTRLLTSYGTFFQKHSEAGTGYDGLFGLLHLTNKAAGQIVLTAQQVGKDEGPLRQLIDAMTLPGLDHVRQSVPVGFHHMVVQSRDVRTMPWLEATQTLNGSGPNQRGKYKSAYMKQPFPARQIDVIWQHLTTKYPNTQALLQVDSYGAKINTVKPEATAVPQRSSILKLQYQTYWTRRRDDAVNLKWIREFYEAMYGPEGPMPDRVMDGCYVNYPDTDLINWEYLYYKRGYARLQRVKKEWDPLNIFNHAQSIRLPEG